MYRIISVMALLLMLGCSQEKGNNSPNVWLSGEIENSVSDYLVLRGSRFCDTLFLNENGSFDAKIKIDKQDYFMLTDGNEYTKLYLVPGDSIDLYLNTYFFDESLIYKGQGANRNNYLNSKVKLQDPLLSEESKLNSVSPESFRKELRKIYLQNTQLIKQESLSGGIDSLFFTVEEKLLPFEYAQFIYDFPYRSLNRFSNNFVLDSTFYEWPESLFLKDTTLLKYSIVQEFVLNKVDYFFNQNLQREDIPDFLSYYQERIKLIAQMPIDPYFISFGQFTELYRGLSVLSEKQSQELFLNYMDQAKPGQYSSQIEALYKETFNNKSSEICNDFSVYNKAGEMMKIPWNQGNYNILIFWGTWCSSSIDELSVLESFPEEINGAKVSIYAISLEESIDQWRGLTTLFDPKINHYYLGNEKHIHLYEGVNFDHIPFLILVDSQAKILSHKLPWPSDHLLDYMKSHI